MSGQDRPLSERAPEVTQLLAQIRAQEAGNDGGWPGGDTVSILCEWFTANGYDIDGPLCPDCGPDRYGRHGVGHACDGETDHAYLLG